MTTENASTKSGRKRREIKRDFVNLDKDHPTVEGTLKKKGTVQINGTDVGRYQLEDDEGREITVLGSQVIDDLLSTIDVGTYIWLSYMGQTKTKSGFPMKEIKLEVEDE